MYQYSPRPIQDYLVRSLQECEVAVVRSQSNWKAIWNLFWLTVPQLDNLPDSGRNWWKQYKPRRGALAAVITDVAGDEVLYRKLTMHPLRFIEWFERDDHSIYECHDLLGEGWIDTVLARAEDAALRLTPGLPRVFCDASGIHIKQATSDDPV